MFTLTNLYGSLALGLALIPMMLSGLTVPAAFATAYIIVTRILNAAHYHIFVHCVIHGALIDI